MSGKHVVRLATIALFLTGCATLRPPPFHSRSDLPSAMPPDVIARYVEARMHLRRKGADPQAIPQAITALKTALAMRPDDASLWQALAEAHAEASDYDAALIAAEEGHARAAQDASIAWTAGEQLFRLGRWLEAEKHFEIAIRGPHFHPDRSLPWFYLYLSRRNLGRVDEALAALAEWHSALPEDPGPRPLRAALLWQEGRVDEAREESLAALRAHPEAMGEEPRRIVRETLPFRPHAAAALLDEISRHHPTSIVLHGELVDRWLDADRPDLALPHARMLVVLDDDTASNLRRLAVVQMALFADDDALETLSRARALVPEGEVDEGIERIAAEILAQRGQWAEAVAVLDRMRPGPLQSARVISTLSGAHQHTLVVKRGQILRAQLRAAPVAEAASALVVAMQSALHLGDIDSANSFVESLRRLDAERADLASIEIGCSTGDRAAAQLRLRAAPSTVDITALSFRGEAAFRCGDPSIARHNITVALEALARTDAAADRLGEGLGRFQWDVEAERRRSALELLGADFALRAGDPDDAESLLRTLLERQPEHASALNFLGFLLADAGRNLGEARALVDRALALKPFDPAVRDSHGWLLFREGRFDDAVAQLRIAAEQSRGDPEILLHLGDALSAAGSPDLARAVWQRAADGANPADQRHGEMAKRALERLR